MTLPTSLYENTQNLFSNYSINTSSIVFDDNGNLYATNLDSSIIVKIDSNGNATPLQFTKGETNDTYIAMVYVNGYLYVTTFNPYFYIFHINSSS